MRECSESVDKRQRHDESNGECRDHDLHGDPDHDNR
jgi:hypothetical protein